MKIQTETKPGLFTTEFWVLVIVNVLIEADQIPLPDKYHGYAAVVSAVGYALARGLAKLGVPRVVAQLPHADPVEAPAPARKPVAK